MVGLLDIRAKRGKSKVDDEQEVDIVGLTFEDIALLVERHESLADLLSGKVKNALEFVKGMPTAYSALVAACAGHIGDENYEKHARTLLIGVQMKIVDDALKLTFPTGAGPLFQLATFVARPAQDFGTLGMNSPKPSLNSTATNIPQSGNSPPGKRPPSSSSAASRGQAASAS